MVDAVSNSVQSQVINSSSKKVDVQRNDDKDKKTEESNRAARAQTARQSTEANGEDKKQAGKASGNDNDRDERSKSARPHRGSNVNILV